MDIIFEDTSYEYWLKTVINSMFLSVNDKNEKILFKISDRIDNNNLEPFHVVLFACLRQYFCDKGYNNCYLSATDDIKNFLIKDNSFDKYWRGESDENYTESAQDTVFNLWRVVDNKIESYVETIIINYLKRKFFKNKDLSAVKLSLLESYHNILDHADAGRNAFSYARFDIEQEKLYVAICDFGCGIAVKMRDHFKDIDDDTLAVLKATEDKITTNCRPHNKGMGIGNIINIIQDDDYLKIVSNSAFLVVRNKEKMIYKLDFNFKGTLIYYEVSLSHFEDEEFVETFAWEY